MPKTSRLVYLISVLAVLIGVASPAAASAGWTGAWSTSPQREAGPAFAAQTLRMLVHPTIGGSSLRVRLSNTFGEADVTFGAVGVARAVASGTADLVAGTQRRGTLFRGGAGALKKRGAGGREPGSLGVGVGAGPAAGGCGGAGGGGGPPPRGA